MKQIMNEKCPVCDERFGLYSEKTQIKSHDGQSIIDIHQHCHDDYRKNPESYNGNDEIVSLKERTAQHEREQQEYRDKLEKIKHIKLTTAYSFSNFQVKDEIGIVTENEISVDNEPILHVDELIESNKSWLVKYMDN